MGVTGDNLAGALLDRALERGWGEKTAIHEGERSWTYAQLRETSARLATALRTLRIDRGDRVAVYMNDGLEASASLLGCVHAGMVVVPISELATASDVRDIINDSGAVAAIVSGPLEPTLDEIRSEAPLLREVLVVAGSRAGERDWSSLVRGSAPAPRATPVDGDEPAFILYSAGARATDGAVRGVVHSHRTPLIAFESIRSSIAAFSEGDRIFSIVRLSTAYGLGVGLLFPLAAGAEAILLSEQPRTDVVIKALERHKPAFFAATPSVYRQLARDVGEGQLQPPLAGIRACLAGAEDMPANVITRVESSLGAKVTVGYGLTEAFQFVVAASMKDGRAGACGRPLPGFELRIVDDADREVGADEIGTLEIRGEALSKRYWGPDRRIQNDDGWFTTRDRFMRDDEGYFYHCGRVDHLFKVSGKWVAPDEVERALLSHEAVWECAVIGADDEDGLIKPLAFVVPNIGHDPDEALGATLRDYVKNEIAPYKYPRWIEFVDELPKGPSGKLLRYKLHDRIRGTRSHRRAETHSG